MRKLSERLDALEGTTASRPEISVRADGLSLATRQAVYDRLQAQYPHAAIVPNAFDTGPCDSDQGDAKVWINRLDVPGKVIALWGQQEVLDWKAELGRAA